MTLYKIKYFYETGDSFRTYKDEGVLPMTWKSLDAAKDALKRIKEHYLWYQHNNRYYYVPSSPFPPVEPTWHAGQEYDFTVILKLDNGNDVQFSAPWCGYFETLESAEIIEYSEEDPELRITF